MNGHLSQSLLDIDQPLTQSLDNFIEGQNLISQIKQALSRKHAVHIMGSSMTGKTHLVNGIQHYLSQNGTRFFRVNNYHNLPNIDTNTIDWLLIDDVDMFQHAEWLVALYQHQPSIKWITSASSKHNLADLQSRLASSAGYSLKAASTQAELHAVIRSIAQRFQYNLSDHFINQCINYLPWNGPICISTMRKLVQHCQQNKLRPTLNVLKSIYADGS